MQAARSPDVVQRPGRGPARLDLVLVPDNRHAGGAPAVVEEGVAPAPPREHGDEGRLPGAGGARDGDADALFSREEQRRESR